MSNRYLIAAFLLVVSVAQPLAGALAPAFNIGIPTGVRATEGGIPPELPPGMFFSIWLPIFTLFLVNALILAFRPAGPDRVEAAFWLAIAGVGNVVWMLSNQLVGSKWLDLFLLFPIFAASLSAWNRLNPLSRGWAPDLLGLNITLLTGWLTAAISISFAPVLRTVLGHGASDAVWGYASLTLAAALVIVFSVRRVVGPSLAYLLAVIWGVTGIALNLYGRLNLDLIGHAAAATGLVFVVLLLRSTATRFKTAS